MNITDKQKQLLQHMLGADERYLKKEWGFRNRFVSSEGNKDHAELLEMEKMGLVKSCNMLGYIIFFATKQGALEIGFKPAQLRRADLAE